MEEEWFPLVDEAGHVTGKATRRECHGGSRMLHPVVHLHVFNEVGELYLQRRPAHKDVQPGKWDTSVGGHVGWGEVVEDALRREAWEELGMTGFRPEFIGRYVFESAVERELVYSYRTVYGGLIVPDAYELDGGRFWIAGEIRSGIGKNIFTPNFETEFHRFLSPTI
ncbi:MAG: NUDIX domain-containing protein [Tannerellaceae bacterium]|nr:NUDIX domain-containing protein [Tannerellaceae bacterium]